METIDLALFGIYNALSLGNLLAVLVGVVLGLAIGVLPALGPSAGVAILLPVVINLDPTVAMAGLAGIYYGAMYGGAITSILLGIPGDSSAMMTTLDGYPMARRGEAGRALGISVYASFIGGLIALMLMTAIAQETARAALMIGPPEMTALMVLSLCLVTVLGGTDPLKDFVSLALGLWFGMVGLDTIAGTPRYTLGMIELLDGVDFSVLAIGVYGLGQMMLALSDKTVGGTTPTYTFRSLFPRLADVVKTRWDILSGSLIGFVLGVLPGSGATASTVFAYAISKRFSRTPEEFGNGAAGGIAAPEAANNSASYGAMIPLLTLGIPGSGTTAVMLGGLLMLGLTPGPMLFVQNSDFVWTLIGTFWIGNLALFFLTILLTPALASIVYIPMRILFPIVTGIVLIGVFSINYSMADVTMAIVFSLLGYVLVKLNYSLTPLLLGMILGPLLERGIRRTLITSGGDLEIFLHKPIAMVLFAAAAIIVVWPFVASRRRRAAGPDLGPDPVHPAA
jgi:putative tricarboxylic transport membrane protein